MFQYFLTVVPTKLNTYQVSAETHQYSVTEQVLKLDVIKFSLISCLHL